MVKIGDKRSHRGIRVLTIARVANRNCASTSPISCLFLNQASDVFGCEWHPSNYNVVIP